MQQAYRLRKLPTPERMQQIAAAWSPHRTVACWYLWRLLDTPDAEPKAKRRPRIVKKAAAKVGRKAKGVKGAKTASRSKRPALRAKTQAPKAKRTGTSRGRRA